MKKKSHSSLRVWKNSLMKYVMFMKERSHTNVIFVKREPLWNGLSENKFSAIPIHEGKKPTFFNWSVATVIWCLKNVILNQTNRQKSTILYSRTKQHMMLIFFIPIFLLIFIHIFYYSLAWKGSNWKCRRKCLVYELEN